MSASITFRQVDATFQTFATDKSGLPPAEHGWFPAAIYDQYIGARATDILETLMRDATDINKFTQQTLGCLALEDVRVEDAPCVPPSGCTWQRTVLPVPPVIGQIIAVTGIGGNLEQLTHYTYRDWQQVKFSLQSRIAAERQRSYYCIRNNYIYVMQRNPVKAIAVAAIFYDPVEVQRYPACDGKTDQCSPFLDYPLYVDPGKQMKLVTMTYQLISGMRNGAPLDTTNNAQPAVAAEPPRPY